MKIRLALLAAVLATAVVAAAPARTVVTILHFNDVYEITPVEGGRSGGVARVATLVSELRRTHPPLMVTLGGDFLSPSAIGTARVNGEPLAGRQMVDVLNAVGLQWATLGNHEFDVSEAAFRQRMTEARFKVVVSNVTDAEGRPFPNTVATAIVPFRAGGRTIRIGLLGIAIDATRKPWVRYLPAIDSARAAAASLKGKADAIVALTHVAIATDAAIAAAVPGIDLILGGHEHENWIIRRGERFTPIVKADANARSVAVVSLAFGPRGARPTVSARLRVIDGRIGPAPAVAARVTRWTSLAFDAFRKDGFDPDAPVVMLTEPLDGREATVRNHPGRLTTIIGDAMRREAKADVGVFNGGSIRVDDVLTPGRLTEYDIIRVLPFGGRVVRASFDGALLAQVLDTGLANAGSGGYLQTSDNVAHTDRGWTIDGAPLDPARRYTVGIADFLLTGAETHLDYLTRRNPHVHDVEDLRDVRRVVIDELKRIYQ